MDTVIGLGSAGCSIADEFAKYPQYDVYKIDVGLKGENCYDIPKQSNPENYERNCPDLGTFFDPITGDILFILAGGGRISGATLAVLKQLKNCNINVLYIKPNKQDLTPSGVLQERLTFNVLQQYARSGLLNTIYLVQNSNIENIIGDVPILQYTKKINEFIVSTIHYINIFKNTKAVINNSVDPDEISRIATFGIHNVQENTEQHFFDFKNERYKLYFFAYPEDVLNKDTSILKNIREVLAGNSAQSSYQIHTTKHDKPFCYFVSFSNVIQSLDN